MFQIQRIEEFGQEVLRLKGDLTIHSATEARRKLEGHLGHCPSLVLDLSEVDEIDTSGVQVLLWFKREASNRGRGIYLALHSSAVINAFDLLGVNGIFGDPILIGHA